jgi:hypothetical protein
VRPKAISSAIRSRAELAGRRRPAADPGQFGPRPARPDPGPEPLEDLEGAVQRRPGGTLLAIAALDAAQGEQRAGVLERLAEALLELQGVLEGPVGGRRVALAGAQQATTATGDGEHPGPLEGGADLLQLLQQDLGLAPVAHGQPGLDGVAVEAEQGRLAEPERLHPCGQVGERAVGLPGLGE